MGDDYSSLVQLVGKFFLTVFVVVIVVMIVAAFLDRLSRHNEDVNEVNWKDRK